MSINPRFSSMIPGLAALWAASSYGQNVVLNPDFDHSLSDWAQSGPLDEPCSWSSNEGSPSAGSVSCIGAPPSGYAEIVQCLTIPAARVDAAVRIKVTAFSGSAVLISQDSPECGQSGPAGRIMHDTGPVDSANPDWHSYTLRFIPMVTPWVSIILGSGGDQVYFDHVYVGPSDTIFTSRFECDTDTELDCVTRVVAGNMDARIPVGRL